MPKDKSIAEPFPNLESNEESYANIEKDEVYNQWYEAFDRRNTQLTYRHGLKYFCEFTGVQPSDLIKEAREDYLNRVPPWELRHVKRIESFLTFLKNKNGDLTNNTKLNYVKSVKHFYTFHKIPVTLNKTGITQGPSEKYLDIPKLKILDIRKAVLSTGTDKFLKAYILTTLSSGQGQNEIRALKGKHLKNIISGVAVVNMTRGKTNRRYFFFIGQEALDAIREYKPNLKDEDYVFTKKWLTTDGNIKNQPLTAQEIDTYFSRHAKKLGFDRSYFAPHRFRHYFKTALTGNMDNTFIEYLLGHKLPGVESSYYLGDQTKILEAYLKNQHLLTIFTENEILQKQYDELKGRHDTETEKLKEEVDALKGLLTEGAIKDMIEARVNEILKKG